MNNILYVTYFLNGFLMIAMPVGLGIYLTRRFHLGWRLWWIGAATFVLSQVGHFPFNIAVDALFDKGILPAPPKAWSLVFSAVFLGLSAGVWESLARYAAYRWWAKDARAWRKGFLLGAGHGGIEAIILGLLVLVGYVSMLVTRNLDLSAMVPAEQLALAQQQVNAYWSANWYDTLLGALERFFTIPLHIAASLLVLQAFTRRNIGWLGLAIGWHALADGLAVYAVSTWGVYAAEALMGVLFLGSVSIIYLLRQPEPEVAEEPAAPLPVQPPVVAPPVQETADKLDETRYN